MPDNEMKLLTETIERIDERTVRIAEDVEHLMRIVALGNGSPPLTIQVTQLGERVKSLEVNKKARYALYVALVTTIGGIASAALGIF